METMSLAEVLGTSIDDEDSLALVDIVRKGVSPLACKKVADHWASPWLTWETFSISPAVC